MNQFIIIFELKEEKSNKRVEVRDRIRELKKFAFLTKYSCLVWTDKSPSEVRDFIKQNLNSGDIIFVSKVSSPAAWLNSVGQDVTDYIQKNLK